MKFGITAKLFIAILLTNLVTALAVGIAIRETFNVGFRDYLGQREARRIERLGNLLASEYRERGSWEFLRDNPFSWHAITRSARDGDPGPPPLRRAPPDGRRGFDSHPPPGRGPEHGPPPRDGRPPEFKGGPGRDGIGSGPTRGPKEDAPPPVLVLDAQQQPVVGQLNPNVKTQRRPIAVDGATVGWLVFEDAPPWFDAADIRFRDEQLQAVWIIGALVMLLASLVAIVLARRVLAPVQRLASATHRLASGEYATRVAPAASDELGQLIDDFNRLARTLENNETLRRNFMADVSHELRTPLAVLRGELEALQDDIRQFTPDSLKSLQAEVSMLSKMIDDLYELALADVGALAYRFEEVDVAALLKESLQGFTDRFASRHLTLDAKMRDGPIMLSADPQRLKQLFNNLLENCVRYTDAGGRVEVSLRRDRNAVRVDVEDSAPGVPATLLPRLFERLFRVEASRSRERGGAGLGLAIVKSVVEAHRGTIVAKPSHLGGLWIQVVLPLAAGGSAP